MKKRKRQHKARIRLRRNSRINAALAPHVGSIQSSLATINANLEGLASLSKSLGCLDVFAKERLAARSRDNLRIEGLKKIFCVACGIVKFSSMAVVDESIHETLASIQRRMKFLANSIGKLLNDEGVRPIVPSVNDAISESEHRIVQTIVPYGPECLPGHVAECLEIGFAVQGVLTPAEVTAFASTPESDDSKETDYENNQE